MARAKRHFNVNNEMGNYFVTFSPSFSLCASSRSSRRLPANRRVMQRGPFDQTNDLRRIHGVSKEIFLYRAIVEAAVKNRRLSK